MNTPRLMIKSPGGRYVAATKNDILQAHAAIAAEQYLPRATLLEGPRQTHSFLKAAYSLYEHELFGMIILDNRHRVVRTIEIFRGTLDGASIHPREVVKTALDNNAAAVILFHNHPSGIAEPSRPDELITLRLKDALGLMDIRVLDHVIVGGNHCVSFAEKGLI